MDDLVSTDKNQVKKYFHVYREEAEMPPLSRSISWQPSSIRQAG
jgi:hypothetical protein